jgi:hypothetical protein
MANPNPYSDPHLGQYWQVELRAALAVIVAIVVIIAGPTQARPAPSAGP